MGYLREVLMMKTKIEHNFKIITFLLLFGTIILGCNKKKKIYLDYHEIMAHSNNQLDARENRSSFVVFSENDSIYLHRTQKEIRIRKIDYLNKITITQLDTAIKRLSKTTFDNLSTEKEKSLPKLFIVKKDSLNNEVKIIEVGQSFVISIDNFEID